MLSLLYCLSGHRESESSPCSPSFIVCQDTGRVSPHHALPPLLFVRTQGELASFPGSSAWVDEKEPGTHCLRMLSSPRISGNLEIFRKICSVTLTSARYADFSRIKDGCH